MLILNAGEIATPVGRTALRGAQMNEIKTIPNGSVAVLNGKIAAVGPTDEIEREYGRRGLPVIDAAGCCVVPGFVDSHTHFIFSGYREEEFLMRLQKCSYLDIMRAGGGIVNTVTHTREQSREGLYQLGKERLREMLAFGVTTLEGKSGYGLDLESELKMLRVQKQLDADGPCDIVASFLGAHAVAPEFKGRADDFINFLIESVLPVVTREKLAEFCDVFCETDVFSVEQSQKLLLAAKKMGLTPKVHADEMSSLGGAQLACRVNAISADHLLNVSKEGIRALAESETVATLLPATAFCLGMPYADARGMIDSGCAVALASDYNPGSCFTNSVPLILSLACIYMGMTAAEALTAMTINGAAAIGRADRIGSVEPGKQADLLILRYPSYKFLLYNTAVNIVGTVIKNGRVAYQNL